jgi:hypothetical protein
MCFNSPAIVNAAQIQARAIGNMIMSCYNALPPNKKYLFAGVMAGWETKIGDDSGVTYGYHSLSNLGYSTANPPSDIYATWASVVEVWIGVWTTALAATGISPDKIFLHVGSLSENGQMANVPFCGNGHPGFSAYGQDYVTGTLLPLIIAHGNPPWALPETSNALITGIPPYFAGPAQPGTTMLGLLEVAFANNCQIVNLFGWEGTGPFGAGYLSPIYLDTVGNVLAYQTLLKL